MKRRHKTLAVIVLGITALGGAAALIFNALGEGMMFFYSPSDIHAKSMPPEKAFRLGGLVKVGSVKRAEDGITVNFVVTDNAYEVPVMYTGILPDLFREGEGVVAQGKLGAGGVFEADEVLAKHDENYMPPEVADALEKAKVAQAEKQSGQEPAVTE